MLNWCLIHSCDWNVNKESVGKGVSTITGRRLKNDGGQREREK